MAIFAFGLNHKTAPVALREKVAVVPEYIEQQLQTLMDLPAVNEATIVSTCNRTEFYCDVEGDRAAVVDWFMAEYDLHPDDHLQYLYQYIDEQSVRHLIRVASGLDSMVVGEPQILGQLKAAYQTAESVGTTGSRLHKLFQFAFSAAKEVRTQTNIGANPVSVAYAGIKLAQELFSDFKDKRALLVGAGETIQLCAQHLIRKNISEIVIANRSEANSQKLADSLETAATTIQTVPLGALQDILRNHDMVVSSTASQLPLIGKGTVESALKQRKRKPIFLLDLAMPRDVEPEVNQLDDAYLYNLDDLDAFIKQNLASRQASAEQADLIVDQKVQAFMLWQQGQTAVNVIRDYRQWALREQQALIEKSQQLQQANQLDEAAIRKLFEQYKNALLHFPTSLLRHLAENNQLNSLLFAEELLKEKRKDPSTKH